MTIEDLAQQIAEHSDRSESRLQRIEDKLDLKANRDSLKAVKDELIVDIKDLEDRTRKNEIFAARAKGAIAILSVIWTGFVGWVTTKFS